MFSGQICSNIAAIMSVLLLGTYVKFGRYGTDNGYR